MIETCTQCKQKAEMRADQWVCNYCESKAEQITKEHRVMW
jgi:Zn finger protein HypA/HybF involved in hydrogenase expression